MIVGLFEENPSANVSDVLERGSAQQRTQRVDG